MDTILKAVTIAAKHNATLEGAWDGLCAVFPFMHAGAFDVDDQDIYADELQRVEVLLSLMETEFTFQMRQAMESHYDDGNAGVAPC